MSLRRCIAMLRGNGFVVAVLILCRFSPCASGQDATNDAEGFFESKVRPVLAAHCVECHGPTKASGGLRLDSREALFKGGDSGPAVTPGNVAGSLLAIAIKHDENEFVQMPPKQALPPQVVADLHAWIAAGAKWPATSSAAIVSDKLHWAFAPLNVVAAPDDPSGWGEQAIDRYIAAGQREQGVVPVRPAGKQALLRRACFDLTGLPPPPDKAETFLAD